MTWPREGHLPRRGRSEAVGKDHTQLPSLDPWSAELEGTRSGEVMRVGDSMYLTPGGLPEHTLLLTPQVWGRGGVPWRTVPSLTLTSDSPTGWQTSGPLCGCTSGRPGLDKLWQTLPITGQEE